jgi:LPXTG-motif cell wall-anchored protein
LYVLIFRIVQFNALMAHANGSMFPADWHGPAVSDFTTFEAAAAISALISAITPPAFVPTTSTSSLAGSTSPVIGPTSNAPRPTSRKGPGTGVMVGAAIAAVGIFALLAGACFFLFRRRRAHRRGLSTAISAPSEPFEPIEPERPRSSTNTVSYTTISIGYFIHSS